MKSDGANKIHVYFPGRYIGDKRTAYSLDFSLSVGFPDLQSSSSGIKMYLDVYGRPGQYDRVKIRKNFPSFYQEVTTYQVTFLCGC